MAAGGHLSRPLGSSCEWLCGRCDLGKVMKKKRKKSKKSKKKAGNGVGVGQLGALVATVLIANAGIMALELVAGRLVARYLGQSLYTWTTIIGVVLTAMSIGNYCGGKLADRFRPLRLLAAVFLLASVTCAATLGLNEWMGTWTFARGLAWPARILVHITGTFLVPCMFLGAISPIIARFAVLRTAKPGRTIGLVYGAAAAGSIGGTFLTGFWLLSVAGSSAIVGAIAVLLVLLAAIYGLASYLSKQDVCESRPDVADSGARDKTRTASRQSWWAAYATVFVSNAGFMVFELTASRMATQHLGHSLYTWTTLLGGVLAGITLGNVLGGLLADRFHPAKLLSLLFVLASASCLLTPGLNTWLGEGTLLSGLPWVARTVAHTAFAFVLPALLLGTMGPVIAKIALGLGRAPGNTLGSLYAFGAVGSVAGTFLTGYLLIDLLWPSGSMCGLAALLALMAVLYRRRSRLAYAVLSCAGISCFLAFSPWAFNARIGSALGLRESAVPACIYTDHSQYSRIAVYQDPSNPDSRDFLLDRLLHSTTDMAEPTRLLYDYQWVYQALLDKCYPGRVPISVLMIGGGGFTFPHYLELARPGSRVEVVEIDPAVTRAAHAVFGFPEDTSVQVYHMDARNRVDDLLALRGAGLNGDSFDCILGDSFNQFSVPFQLVTLEYTQALYELLSDDGIYMLNLIDNFQSGQFVGSVIATCRLAFPHVYVFTCSSTELSVERDTFVVVCAKQEQDIGALPRRMRESHPYEGELLNAVEVRTLVERAGHRILTDDYAPVDNLLARVANIQAGRRFSITTASMIEEGRGDEALAGIRKALQESSGDRRIAIAHHLGVTLARLDRQAEAVEVFRDILAQEPDNHEIHLNLATALGELGKLDKAIPHYEAALRGNPDMASAHFVLGQVRRGERRIPEALHHLSETVRLEPGNGYAHYLLGRTLVTQGKHQEALTHLAEGSRLMPDSADAHYAHGNALAAAGRHDAAGQEFRAALDINPDLFAAHMNLGNIYHGQANHEAAVKHYTEAARVQPNHAGAHYNLGNAVLSLGDPRKALEHFKQALTLDPGLDAARRSIEKVERSLGGG